MKRKESKVWTVRNRAGQYVGSFRAYSADEAVSAMIRSQAQTAATFRRSQPLAVKREDFTATTEA